MMTKFHRGCCLLSMLIIILGGVTDSPAQTTTDDFKFQTLTPLQGLSHTVVNCALQDEIGFLWIGTQDGLNKYDGYSFTVFQNNPLDSTSIQDNNIRAMIKDRNGIFWLASWGGGLIKFDPLTEQFTQYINDPSDPRSLKDNWLHTIFQDRTGKLWVGTQDHGLAQFFPESGEFQHYQNDPENPNSISHNRVWSMAEDSRGHLWLGTANGLNRFIPDDRFFSFFPIRTPRPDQKDIRTIFVDNHDALWLGTADGLARFTIETESLEWLDVEVKNGQNGSRLTVNTIYQDRRGNFWIGTFAGLFRYDPDRQKLAAFTHDVLDRNSLSHNDIRFVLEDKSGILWIGTGGGGLNRCDLKPLKFKHLYYDPTDETTLSDNRVNALWVDRNSTLWVGTQNGLNKYVRGIFNFQIGAKDKLNTSKPRFIKFLADPNSPRSLTSSVITCLYEDQSGVLWIGTDAGLNKLVPGFNRFDPSQASFKSYTVESHGLSHNRINAMLEDRQNRFWIATDNGLCILDRDSEKVAFFRHDPHDQTTLSGNRIQSILEDHNGIIWIGIDGGGLNRLQLQPGQDPIAAGTRLTFQRFLSQPADPNSLSHNRVLSLRQDSFGNLWIGTIGGLNQIVAPLLAGNPESVRFSHFTTKDGLPNNTIFGILEDQKKHLWISTNNGLAEFVVETKTFRNYDISDGLQSNTFHPGACFKSPTDEMYFGGLNGLNQFYPEQVEDNPFPPPIAITSFTVFDKPLRQGTAIAYTDYLELSYKQNFFTCEFAALDFTQPEKNQYAYMLIGVDKNWIRAGTRRYASYTDLDGGLYTLKVIAANNDGVWNNEGQSLKIRIIPPYWKKWWFHLVEITAGFALLIGIFFLVIYRLKRQKEDALRELELKHQQRELEAARAIQLSMVSQQYPAMKDLEIAAKMESAKLVGGDYYDFILSPGGNKLYVVIADVSGKGVPSSLLMVSTRSILHSLTSQGLSTQEMIIETNKRIYEDTARMKDPMMVTMLLMEWDINAQALKYTGAGHEHILIYRQESQKVEVIKTGGLWLGAEKKINSFVVEKELDFNPGDMILLYTDGVTEFRNPKDHMFGLKQVIAYLEQHGHLSPHDFVESLFHTLNEFAQGATQFDDTTVVVLKKKW